MRLQEVFRSGGGEVEVQANRINLASGLPERIDLTKPPRDPQAPAEVQPHSESRDARIGCVGVENALEQQPLIREYLPGKETNSARSLSCS